MPSETTAAQPVSDDDVTEGTPEVSEPPRAAASRGEKSRRAPRSRRSVVAVALLAAGVVAVGVAAFAGTFAVALAAGVVAAVAGMVAARLLNDVTARTRRDWAYDRAALADSYRQEALTRRREQQVFADSMTARVTVRDGEIAALRRDLDRTEARRAELEEALAEESARMVALSEENLDLTSSLDDAQAEVRRLRETVAESRVAEHKLRETVRAWEQAEHERSHRQPA